jgi:hypothetical protein
MGAARWTRGHLALWLLAAGAAGTAVIALIAELLARPGQPASAVNGLILLSLVPLALSFAFPVVGSIVEKRDKDAEEKRNRIAEAAAEQEQSRREQAGRLLAWGHLPSCRVKRSPPWAWAGRAGCAAWSFPGRRAVPRR